MFLVGRLLEEGHHTKHLIRESQRHIDKNIDLQDTETWYSFYSDLHKERGSDHREGLMSWEERQEWFYVKSKQQRGPATFDELAELLARGKPDGISPETHVWCGEMEKWTRLKELPLLQLLQAGGAKQAPEERPARAALRADDGVRTRGSLDGARVARAQEPQPVDASQAQPQEHALSRSQGRVNSQPRVETEPNPHSVGNALPVPSPAVRGKSTNNKNGFVRNFLKGWLPQRAPPRELVERGILQNEPIRGSSDVAPTPSPHALFGNELATILGRADSENGVPRVINILMQRLRDDDSDGLRNEGIFRVPGEASEMKELRDMLNQGGDPAGILRSCTNPHSIAGLLKMFYRELTPPLLTFELYDDFIACATRLGSPTAATVDTGEISALLERLPSGHAHVLSHLVGFLGEVVELTSENKMTVGNTAAVFAPNLLRPKHETFEQLADAGHVVNLISFLIGQRAALFGLPDPRAAPPLQAMPSAAGSSRDVSARLSSATESSEAPPANNATRAEQAAAIELSDDSSSMGRWYWLTANHDQQGPAAWSDLQAMLATCQITPETYIFCEGKMADWALVSDFDLSGLEPE